MAVVHFEAADGQRGHVEAATLRGERADGGPASGGVSVRFLRGHEHIAHLQVPRIPFGSAIVMNRLGRVVPVVDVRLAWRWQFVTDHPVYRGGERGVIASPAEINAA